MRQRRPLAGRRKLDDRADYVGQTLRRGRSSVAKDLLHFQADGV